MNMKAKVISCLLLIAFLGTGVFSFVHAMDMTTTEGVHHTGDCPLVEGQQVLCSISPIEHLTSWQRATNVNPKDFIGLLVILPFLAVIFTFFKFLSDNYWLPSRSYQRSFIANLPIDLYTRIFSDGLLNSKVY